MNNNRQKPTHLEKTNVKKIPQFQLLNLEQLNGVAGGPVDIVGGSGGGHTGGSQPSA